MEKNKQILTEMFFKKKSYNDKLKSKFPQYEPQDVKINGNPGFGSILSTDKFAVTDKDEAIKRLTGFLGSQMATTTIKSLASKSIKSFPIIISDNVEPETSVLLKRVMEEQYAEYINLLISNQLIDISAFRTGEDEGNIAVQAIQNIVGTDSQSIGRKAMKNSLTSDDILGNVPLYGLIRREEKEYSTGIELFDTLLENALIVPSEDAKEVLEFLNENMQEILALQEGPTPTDIGIKSKYVTLDDYLDKHSELQTRTRDKAIDALRGMTKTDESSEIKRLRVEINKKQSDLNKENSEIARLRGIQTPTPADTANLNTRLVTVTDITDQINELKADLTDAEHRQLMPGTFNKLSTPNVLLDPVQLEASLDRTIGEMLLRPGNEAIKDRFEKATFLLHANRISGSEYIDYLVQRLGIPIPSGTRGKLSSLYRTQDIRSLETPGARGSYGVISRKEADLIMNNQKLRESEPILKAILGITGRYLLRTASVGAMGGAVIWSLTLAGSAIGMFILPAVLGGAGLFTLIKSIINARNQRRLARRAAAIQGWERVEALIVGMEAQQESIRNIDQPKDDSNPLSLADSPVEGPELKALLAEFSERISKIAKAAVPIRNESAIIEPFVISENALIELNETAEQVLQEAQNDIEFMTTQLSEAVISSTTPIKLIKKYEFDPKEKPELLVTPSFAARATYAYAEVEYEKRDIKDRRYNTPLMMTVKFKERFSDGTFADNELTAVIGILGVINRIPSEEMEYVLKSNIEGTTVKGIFKALDKDINTLAATLLNAPKIKKDVDKLPQSLDVWKNLENISRLAAANKLAGKQNNNIANAHIIFSQKEIDNVRSDTGIDYLKDKKLAASLMQRYSAFTLMIANDVSERVYIYDDPNNISWNVVPYGAFRNKDTGEQLNAMLSKMSMGSGRM